MCADFAWFKVAADDLKIEMLWKSGMFGYFCFVPWVGNKIGFCDVQVGSHTPHQTVFSTDQWRSVTVICVLPSWCFCRLDWNIEDRTLAEISPKIPALFKWHLRCIVFSTESWGSFRGILEIGKEILILIPCLKNLYNDLSCKICANNDFKLVHLVRGQYLWTLVTEYLSLRAVHHRHHLQSSPRPSYWPLDGFDLAASEVSSCQRSFSPLCCQLAWHRHRQPMTFKSQRKSLFKVSSPS